MQAVNDVTDDHDFTDLHKFQLTEEDWTLLKEYVKILKVIFIFSIMHHADLNLVGSSCIPGNLEWQKYTNFMLFYSGI